MKPDFFAGARAAALPVVMTAALGLLLSCSVGEGILPTDAKILPLGGALGATSSKAFTCLNSGLNLSLYFSNGSSGDFTTRATYSSSNPAVADVNSGATLFNGTPYHLIVPKAVGTTTITAKYLTFTRTLDVTVSAIGNLRTVPTSLDLAANSQVAFSAVADLDGVETALGTAATWSFVAPNDALATIDATSGVIKGVAAGSLTARATLPLCGQTTDAQANIANLQSLALTREFGDNGNLVVATTERVIATGTLDNGKTQDLSLQVAYASSDTSALSFFTGALANLSFALKAVDAPVQVTATFANPSVTSPAIGIRPIAGSLSSIAVTPATVTVAPGRTAQFNVTGSYASGATQDITRHVTWSSSDTSAAVIQSSNSAGVNGFAGSTATAASASGKSVQLTAATTNSAGAAITSAGTLNIQ